MKKYILGASMAAILALTAACSGNDNPAVGNSSPDAASAPASETQQDGHNEADITFAQQMIPHHKQAIDMAEMALQRSTTPEVKDLAERIKNAQDPEIQQLTNLLETWGAPTAPMSEMPGMDHGSMSGSGMMTEEDMRRLEQATGSEFDKLWMQMMIEHHQGAVEMAKTELEQGQSGEAKSLARRIVNAQEQEIREMETLMQQ